MKKILPLLLFPMLSGCIAPGMKMQDPPQGAVIKANEMHINPTFIPITAHLLEQMHTYPVVTKDAAKNPHVIDSAYQYKVKPEDVISINVWQHPEFNSFQGQAATVVLPGSASSNNGAVGLNATTAALSGSQSSSEGYLVDSDGTIYLPLVGKVYVANQSIDQIRTVLAKKLSKYVRNPQVDVRVVSFRSQKVYVMGEVTKAGLQPITDIPMSITDAINLAGGLVQDSADPAHIYIIRGDILNPTVYWLNAQSADALILASQFRLQNHDILFVSTASVARWNRAISQIMPTIQSVWYTQSTIHQAGG